MPGEQVPESKRRRKQWAVVPDEIKDPQLPKGVFSYSQYSTYKKCGEAYRRQYIEGHRTPPTPGMLQGTLVHVGAEEAHLAMIETGKVPELEAVQAIIKAKFKTESKEVVDWGEDKPEDILAKALKVYEAYHTLGLPKLRPIAAEKPFAMKIGTVPMQGYIDLIDTVSVVLEEGKDPVDTPIVTDMKTSAATWSQNDADLDPQFTLYSIVENVDTVRVDNLVSLKAGPKLVQITSKRDAHAKRVFIEDLEETVDLVKRGIFPKTSIDNWACSKKWCGYYTLCRGKRT